MTDSSILPTSSASNQLAVLPTRHAATGGAGLTKRERDYLFLTIYVRAQHLQFEEALTLVETLASLGDEGPDLYLARAVISYQMGAFEEALSDLRHLDRIDPPNMMASADDAERSRIRSFMKAKCAYALTGALDEESQASLDFYLRRRRLPEAAE